MFIRGGREGDIVCVCDGEREMFDEREEERNECVYMFNFDRSGL